MTDTVVPPPFSNIARLKLASIIWHRAKPFHHIYTVKRGPCAFNPGQGAGRFHPISDRKGKAITTLYVADCIEGAAMETVFRATGPTPPSHVPRKYIDRHGYSTIKLARPARILPLWGNNLRRLGLLRAQLLEPGPKFYSATARWAEALHRSISSIKGLAWYSRQFDGAVSVMFFGDRVNRKDFIVTRDWGGFEGDAAYEMIAEVANKANVVITEN